MRTTKRFLVTSLIIFSTSCLQVSCCSKPVPSERSALIDNLDSFLSPEEVRARLNPSEGTWRIAGRSSLDRGDPRPRFDILVVEVENYESSGVRGKLKLVFFNDRLYKTQFFTSDIHKVIENLKEKTGVTMRGSTTSLPPRTVISIGVSVDAQQYIIFKDSYLEDEIDCWTLNYS